jgi:protein phosphatase methylesterase 1
MSNLQKSIFKKPPLNPLKHLSANVDDVDISKSLPAVNMEGEGEELNYDPTPLGSYMQEQVVEMDGDSFHVYTRLASTPVAWFVFHHGAGHVSLTSNCMWANDQSAATWALTFEQMDELSGKRFSLLAYDCRGHGKTQTRNDSDLCLDTLTNDLIRIVNWLSEKVNHDIRGDKRDTPFKVCLVGHSMGGPVVVEAAKQLQVSNVTVLDVVEGTAMESITYMEDVIESTPNTFAQEQDAIKWILDSHRLYNANSARISIPCQLKASSNGFTWRVNLSESRKYWIGWFTGLSAKFLSLPIPKQLVVAGSDRLDKELMIGQMQGKFKYVVLPSASHCVQEDAPGATSSLLVTFWDRNNPIKLLK